MLGEFLALISALLWATVGVVMGYLSPLAHPLVIATARLVLGSLFLLPLMAVLLHQGDLGSLSSSGVMLLMASGVLSLGIGDTIYVMSLRFIGVSRAHPISITLFPLFTFVLAALFLDELITLTTVAGASLIVAGIILVVLSGRARKNPSPASVVKMRQGVTLVVVAAALWAAGFVLLKMGAGSSNPSVAGFIRVASGGVFILGLMLAGRYHTTVPYRKPKVWAGFLWMGVMTAISQGFLTVKAVVLAGAAKTSVLVSLSPLFVLPLAFFFLNERVTWRTVLGTALAIAGTWLVVLG